MFVASMHDYLMDTVRQSNIFVKIAGQARNPLRINEFFVPKRAGQDWNNGTARERDNALSHLIEEG